VKDDKGVKGEYMYMPDPGGDDDNTW